MLYSYLLRLSNANGFDDIRDFRNAYVDEHKSKYKTVSYDLCHDLYQFAASVTGCAENQVLSFYLQTSLFHGIAPLCRRSYISQYVGSLSKYKYKTDIRPKHQEMVRKLRFCPECLREDLSKYGYLYYRRSHHMPDVTVCHAHGCTLHVYAGEHGEEMSLPLQSIPLPTYPKSHEYSVFCKDILDAKLECDLSEIIDAITDRLKDLGSHSKKRLTSGAMSDYLDLMNQLPETLIRFIRKKSSPHQPSMLALLLFLFQDITTLKQYLTSTTTEIRKSFDKEIANKFTLLSSFRKDIVELQCKKCDEIFLSTPTRILDGWGCPICDDQMDDELLFNRLFGAKFQKDYECSKFEGFAKPISIRHKRCGKEYKTIPMRFLCQHTHCKCERTVRLTEARRQIAAQGDFDLVDFQNTYTKISIRHKTCGSIFGVMYHVFLKDSRCSVCQAKKRGVKKAIQPSEGY